MGYKIMSKYTVLEHNVETGEVITRPMTGEEILALEQEKINTENARLVKQAEAEAKAAQKAALLERLGINEDEARLLLA
jgi:ribosomal protein L15E